MRNRVSIARVVCLFSAGLACTLAAGAWADGPATAPTVENQIGQAIALLSSPDPTERDQGQQSLVQLDRRNDLAVRDALKTAAGSNDPAIAMGAEGVVNRLPWYTADDSPDVKQLLADYGAQGVEQRRTVVAGLSQLQDQGLKVLLRIIGNEPSDVVRWEMVRVIEGSNETSRKVAAREVAVVPDSPPLLALRGWAWSDFDQHKATDYYQAALDQWKLSPHDATPEETDLLMDPLYEGDVQQRRYDQAADVMRAQLRVRADDGDLLFQLFSLHAEFGPLRGYADDCALAGANLESPMLLLCQSRIEQRLMRPERADAFRRKALAATANDLATADDVAVKLMAYGWNDLAEAQLHAILDTPAGPGSPGEEVLAESHFQLAEIHSDDGKDEQAVDDQKAGMDLLSPADQQSLAASNAAVGAGGAGNEAAVEQGWSELKAARAKNNPEKITETLDALVQLGPQSPDIVQDVVPMLTAARRNAEAKTLFDRVYTPLRAAIDADPENPMYMNNLAWFCSQSGQRLDEADQLARKAVAAMPHEASYIDTLAFCEYQLGRPAEAVRLETIALSIDRDDFVMIQSLDRYRAAAAGSH